MVDAFADSADFSAMSAAPVKLKAVFHDAFVRVDENGTEAAASTAVVSTLISAPQLSKTVNVNRPFFFFVRDVLTKAVLFIGRIMDSHGAELRPGTCLTGTTCRGRSGALSNRDSVASESARIPRE